MLNYSVAELRCIRNAISETPGIFLVGKRESDVCILGYNCIYNSVSVPCVQPQFFRIGCTVNHHRQLFKCKGMAAQADTKHQSMLSLSAKIFCSRLPQSEIGYSTKKSLPIVWLTALLGCHLLKHVKRLR